MKSLQAEWKTVGFTGRSPEADELWKRFRGAADVVFARRRETAEEELLANQAKKETLLARAIKLAEEGTEDADGVVRELQREWRKIGRVPPDRDRALWNEFRTACSRLRKPEPWPAEELGDGESLRFNPFSALQTDSAPDED
jgi:hypothetical protein